MPLTKIDRPHQLLRGITVEQLARASHLPNNLLWALARKSDQMYKSPREQEKPNGGVRVLDPVKRRYRVLLRRLGRTIIQIIGIHPAWHGGTPRRSSFTSARQHHGCRFLVTRDVRNCFGTINRQRLFKAFRRLGASWPFAKFLASIMTVRDRIPQGGPLSNLAVNLFFLRQDQHLLRRAKDKGGRYGRLTDDLVVSAPSLEAASDMGEELDRAITERGLTVNKRKRDKRGFVGGDTAKELHSLRVSSRRGIAPKLEHKRKALARAEHYARRCACATPHDLIRLASLREGAVGWVYYMSQADFSPARHIAHMIMVADRRVLRMLKSKGLVPHKHKWWIKQEAAHLQRLYAKRRTTQSAA